MSITIESEQPVLDDKSFRVKTGRGRGLVLALVATVLWSTTGPFIEILTREYQIKPVELSFWRTFLIAALLAPLIAGRYGFASFKLSPQEFGLLALNGVVGIALFSVCWSGSVQANGTAVATTLLYCAPVFVAVGGWLFLHEKLGLGQASAIGLSVVGCALVAGVYDPATLVKSGSGIVVGLLSGLTFAFYILVGKLLSNFGEGKREPLVELFYVFFFGAVVLLAWGLFEEGVTLLQPGLDGWGWLLLIAMAYGPTLCGYIMFNRSLKYLAGAVASLITTLEQPVAALLALALFGRGMHLIQWVGAGLVLGSVLILQLKNLRETTTTSR